MVGEGGAFLFLLVTFSQDSHDFSQRWKNEGFLGGKRDDIPFFFTF